MIDMTKPFDPSGLQVVHARILREVQSDVDTMCSIIVQQMDTINGLKKELAELKAPVKTEQKPE